MLLPDLRKVLVIFRRSNDQQQLWPSFVSESHGLQLKPVWRGRGYGLHIVNQPVVGHVPFPHLVINNILWLGNGRVVGNAVRQVIRKVLAGSVYHKERANNGAKSFSHTVSLQWDRR